MDTNTTWLEGLKAGDTVATRTNGFGKYYYQFCKVARVTKTQIVVIINPANGAESKFNRVTGQIVGYDGWHPYHLVEPTEELISQIKADNRRQTIINTLEKTSWTKQTTEVLEAVYAALNVIKGEETK